MAEDDVKTKADFEAEKVGPGKLPGEDNVPAKAEPGNGSDDPESSDSAAIGDGPSGGAPK